MRRCMIWNGVAGEEREGIITSGGWTGRLYAPHLGKRFIGESQHEMG